MSIFVDRKRRQDLLNSEEAGGEHWSYYVTVTLQVIFIIGFIWGVGLVLVTAYVPHTHFRPGELNNNLYSERYTSLWWMALFFASMRFLFFLAMQSMYLYRNTMCRCEGRNTAGCTVFWMIILFALCALDLIALAITSNYLATCNGITAAGNPCNDPAWCCRAEVHADPRNHCPNIMTCPDGGPPVSVDGIFAATFAFNVVFVVLELYFVAQPMVLWFLSTSPSSFSQKTIENDDDNNENDGDAAARAEERKAVEEAAQAALMSDSISLASQHALDNNVSSAAVAVKRRIPQTPLLVAAAAAGIPMVHVTPPTHLEKNTKQP